MNRRLAKKHPVIGNDILRTIKGRAKLCAGAKRHHERYDGKGYPDGLAGMDISEEARIIAVADAYDAMTSRQRYRMHFLRKKFKRLKTQPVAVERVRSKCYNVRTG